MKKRDILISIFILVCLLLAVILSMGCKREAEAEKQLQVFSKFDEEKHLVVYEDKPVIEFLDMNAVHPKQTFTIYGNNFGKAEGSVMIMNNKAETISWNEKIITAKIPENITSGTLRIKSEKGFSNGIPIIVLEGEEYYISEDGTDEGEGTKKMPWRTFEKVMQYVKPGDVIYVGPGNYNFKAKNGELNKPIVIKGFSGNEINNTLISDGENIILSGLNFRSLEVFNSSNIFLSDINSQELIISKCDDIQLSHSDISINGMKIKEYSGNIKVAYTDFYNSKIGMDSDESSQNIIIHDSNAYNNSESGFSLRSRKSAAFSINATNSNKGIIIGETTKVINCISNNNDVGITLTAFSKPDIVVYNCISINNNIGLDIKNKVKAKVMNNIFSNNNIAIQNNDKAEAEIDFSLFHNNEIIMVLGDDEYNNMKKCRACGLFSKTGNPRFDKGFRLQGTSSAIDSGKTGPGLDYAHKPRKYGLTTDIGPYEYST